ncbi:MAG TPA: hypothetical protein PKA53_10830 [Sphingobacterium sp.]|nr:hypothetical protein [Sphingobacterium sp.]
MKPLTNVQMGTLGGTLCSIWPGITPGDIMQTMAMATIGAITSYAVSRLLDRRKKR